MVDHSIHFFKHRITWIATFMVATLSCFAQTETENSTSDYVNSVFYYENLDILRGSYTRWKALEKIGGEEANPGISAVYNFNWGRNIEGDTRVPMTFGLGFGKKVGFYFMTFTSHMRVLNFSSTWEENWESDSEHRFTANTVGLSWTNKYFSLLADVTYIQKNWSYFVQFSIPAIKTRAGVSFSQFNESQDFIAGENTIVRGDSYSPEFYYVTTSIVPGFNLGLDVFSYSKVKASPNIDFSLYRLRSPEKWQTMKIDAQVYFASRAEGWEKVLRSDDYDFRFSGYYFFGYDESSMVNQNSGGVIVGRMGLVASVSYKSGTDLLAETIQESNSNTYYLTGWGGEFGFVWRMIGFKKYGAVTEDLLKLVMYYNYSEYNELYPPLIGGLKFKVTL